MELVCFGLLARTRFSNGSRAPPRWRNLRNAGWAVVQVDDFGNATVAAYGAVLRDLCPMQVAKDGEDHAIAMFAQLTIYKVFIDCHGTLDCFMGGKAKGWVVSNARAHRCFFVRLS